jgi:hypothetical protein
MSIPEIGPGEIKWVRLAVVPVGTTGWVGLPGVKVWEGSGEEVRVGVKNEKGSRVYVRP